MRKYSKKTKALGIFKDWFYAIMFPFILIGQLALLIPAGIILLKDRGNKLINGLCWIVYYVVVMAAYIAPWTWISKLEEFVEKKHEESKAEDEGKIHLVTDED